MYEKQGVLQFVLVECMVIISSQNHTKCFPFVFYIFITFFQIIFLLHSWQLSKISTLQFFDKKTTMLISMMRSNLTLLLCVYFVLSECFSTDTLQIGRPLEQKKCRFVNCSTDNYAAIVKSSTLKMYREEGFTVPNNKLYKKYKGDIHGVI